MIKRMAATLALAAALGWASGLRLYLAVFLVGAVGHLGWVRGAVGALLAIAVTALFSFMTAWNEFALAATFVAVDLTDLGRLRMEALPDQAPVAKALNDAIGRLSEVGEPLVQPLQGTVGPETPIARLREIFNDDNVAVVRDGDRVIGILTKIDLIDFLGSRMK